MEAVLLNQMMLLILQINKNKNNKVNSMKNKNLIH